MHHIEKLFGDWKSLAIYPISLFGLDFIHIEMFAKILLWILAIIAGVLNIILLMKKISKK